MLTMIDMEMGNLQSVLEAFDRIGADAKVTTSAQDVHDANVVILPGVGAFGDGMASLHANKLVEPLRLHALEKKKPLLGICIGMQLLVDEGEEYGLHEGLGLIRGRAVRLKPTEVGCRVPNMGWCDVSIKNPQAKLFAKIAGSEAFYFAHSFQVECTDPADIAATIDYSGQVTAAIEHHNIFGVQFHPEKSQDAGLNVLAAFLDHVTNKSRIAL